MATATKAEEKTPATKAKKAKLKPAMSLRDRMSKARVEQQLLPGESLDDICLFRNRTEVPQVVTDDLGKKHTLPQAGLTGRSWAEVDKKKIKPSEGVKFAGGTVLMSRGRGLPLVASNILELIDVVDRAADYEAEGTKVVMSTEASSEGESESAGGATRSS